VGARLPAPFERDPMTSVEGRRPRGAAAEEDLDSGNDRDSLDDTTAMESGVDEA
jgi:hypothetical protein